MNLLKKNKFILGFLSLLLLVIYFGNYLTSDKSLDNQPTNLLETAKKTNIKESVLVTGKVETANYFPITTSVNGIVKKIFVKEGDKVVKGQKIMEISLNSDGEADYQNALSSYISAKISLEKAINDKRSKESIFLQAKYDYERTRDKVKDSNEYKISLTTSLNNFESAETLYKLQDETITQAEISLRKAYLSLQSQSPTILAPESGIVSNITYVEGMDISNSLSERSSVSVASIKNEGQSIISFSVSELDINKIKNGQKVLISISSISGEKFDGEVVGVDRVGAVSNNLAQYTVIIKLTQISNQIYPNMKADGEILINEKNDVLAIPTSAIKSKGNSKIVKLENGEEISISTGISNSSFTEIVSGLNEGDKVLVEALPTSGFINTNNNTRTPSLFGR